MLVVPRIHDRVIGQAWKFFPNVIISIEAINLFQPALEVTQKGDPGTPALEAST